MTVAQYLRLLREQWIAVLLLTLLGTLGAAAYSLRQTPEYQAHAQLFVSTSSRTRGIGELAQSSTFTQARVKSYGELLTSPRVLDPVIRRLFLDTTAADLATKVTATTPLGTVLIDIAVTDPSPSRAAGIANAIATQFPAVVKLLEAPDRRSRSPIRVSVTRAAVAPPAPVSPRPGLDLALGLLVGLGLGIGLAVVRDSLDRTVSGRTQASRLAAAPVLGSLADDPSTAQAPLIIRDGFSARAEAFRQLRTNIRFLSVDQRIGSLVVTGSVQGEGKTTTAANLAVAMAQNGERVVLVDADLRRPAVADVFGLPGGIGLTTVLRGDVPVDAALQQWRDDLPLQVLPAGPLPPNPSELIGSARMAELVRELTGRGLTVVVDSPPLLPVTDATILARITDGALLVTRLTHTRADQLTTAVEALRTAGSPILGVVLTRVPRRGRPSSGGGHYGSHPSNAPSASRTANGSRTRSDSFVPLPLTAEGPLTGTGRSGSTAQRRITSGAPTPAPPPPRSPSASAVVPGRRASTDRVDRRDASVTGRPTPVHVGRSAYPQHLAGPPSAGYATPDAGVRIDHALRPRGRRSAPAR
ncbi:MAG TPA: polysaccharide biosynthesis tyrosine autokinase [Kineosporiaceae bacterium]